MGAKGSRNLYHIVKRPTKMPRLCFARSHQPTTSLTHLANPIASLAKMLAMRGDVLLLCSSRVLLDASGEDAGKRRIPVFVAQVVPHPQRLRGRGLLEGDAGALIHEPCVTTPR